MGNSLLQHSGRYRVPRFADIDPGKPSPLPKEEQSKTVLETSSPSPNISITPKVSSTPEADDQEKSDGGVSDGLGTIIGSIIGGMCVIVGAYVGVRRSFPHLPNSEK